MNYLKKTSWYAVLYSIWALITGILMIMYPQYIVTTLGIFVGAIPIILGIKYIWFYKDNSNVSVGKTTLIIGCILVFVGLFILFNIDAILSFVTYALAAIILVSGIMKVKDALDLKKMRERWIPLMVFAGICIVLGLLVITMPMNHNDDGTRTAGDFIIQCAGGILAFTGLVDFIKTLTISGKIREWKEYINTHDDK